MKKYVYELTEDEAKKVWDANEKLRQNYYETMYEDNMEQQLRDGKMFLDNVQDCYRYHDSYNSFFFTLEEFKGYKFLSNINLIDLRDYSIVDIDTILDCHKYVKLYEEYDYSKEDNEHDIDEIVDKLDELAKQVLEGIEKYLHEYEDIDYSCAFDDWYEHLDYCCDLYIKDDSYKAYCDYTECYA